MKVQVDKDLADIVPPFLERLHNQLSLMEKALEQKQVPELESFGHKLKGTGRGYGFNMLSTYGDAIEKAARLQALDDIESQLKNIQKYLKEIEIEYIES